MNTEIDDWLLLSSTTPEPVLSLKSTTAESKKKESNSNKCKKKASLGERWNRHRQRFTYIQQDDETTSSVVDDCKKKPQSTRPTLLLPTLGFCMNASTDDRTDEHHLINHDQSSIETNYEQQQHQGDDYDDNIKTPELSQAPLQSSHIITIRSQSPSNTPIYCDGEELDAEPVQGYNSQQIQRESRYNQKPKRRPRNEKIGTAGSSSLRQQEVILDDETEQAMSLFLPSLKPAPIYPDSRPVVVHNNRQQQNQQKQIRYDQKPAKNRSNKVEAGPSSSRRHVVIDDEAQAVLIPSVKPSIIYPDCHAVSIQVDNNTGQNQTLQTRYDLKPAKIPNEKVVGDRPSSSRRHVAVDDEAQVVPLTSVEPLFMNQDSPQYSSNVQQDTVFDEDEESPIPITYRNAILQAFGNYDDDDNFDLYRDVFGLNPFRCTEQQLRIAYFKRGREILQEKQRKTKDSRTAKNEFQAVTMAFEILSKPAWKEFYDKHGFGHSVRDPLFTKSNNRKVQHVRVSITNGNDSMDHFSNVSYQRHHGDLDSYHDKDETMTPSNRSDFESRSSFVSSNNGVDDGDGSNIPIISSRSFGSSGVPILRQVSSWGSSTKHKRRPKGTRLRWNEQVEELVFKEDPGERAYKARWNQDDDEEEDELLTETVDASREADANYRDSEKNIDESHDIGESPPQRIVKIKKRNRRKSKRQKDAQLLFEELEELDKHFKESSHSVASDIFDDLETSLEGLGAKLGGFIKFAFSDDESETDNNNKPLEKKGTDGDKKCSSFRGRPDPETYFPENSILDSEYSSTLVSGADGVRSHIFDPTVQHPVLDIMESSSKPDKDSEEQVVKKLFNELTKPPDFTSSSLLADSNSKANLSVVPTDSGEVDFAIMSKSTTTHVSETTKEEKIETKKEKPIKQSLVGGIDRFVKGFPFNKSESKKMKTSSKKEKLSSLVNLPEIHVNESDWAAPNPSGLVVRAKIKHHSVVHSVTSFESSQAGSLSELTPGTAGICRSQSGCSRISGRETILDDDLSKYSPRDDTEMKPMFNPNWDEFIKPNEDKADRTPTHCYREMTSAEEVSSITDKAARKGLLRAKRSSTGTFYGHKKGYDDRSIAEASMTTTQIEQAMHNTRNNICQGMYCGPTTGGNNTTSTLMLDGLRQPATVGPSQNIDVSSLSMSKHVNNDFVNFVQSCVQSLVADVAKIGVHLEEARKAVDLSFGLNDEGVGHVLDVLEKEIEPVYSFASLEKTCSNHS